MSSFKTFFIGLPFLLKSAGIISSSSVQIEEVILPSKLVPDKKYRVKYFLTKKRYKKKPPTILLTHGMSGYGIEDARMVELAVSLSSCGYNVVVPEFIEIKALKITPESVQNIKDVFLVILDQERLNTENIGFFSISFSAGYGLVALTDSEIASRVKSIVVVGGFAELLDTCSFAIRNYLKDDYPTNILFYNYLHLLYDNPKELIEIFYEAALDNGFSRSEQDKVVPKLYQKLDTKSKEIFDRVRNDADFRKDLIGKINAAYAEPARSISPLYCIEKIKAPVCFIHGKNDKVISENESLKLAAKMKQFGLEFKLYLTGLLSHGDKLSVWSQLHNIPRLASSFGYFFEKLNEKE